MGIADLIGTGFSTAEVSLADGLRSGLPLLLLAAGGEIVRGAGLRRMMRLPTLGIASNCSCAPPLVAVRLLVKFPWRSRVRAVAQARSLIQPPLATARGRTALDPTPASNVECVAAAAAAAAAGSLASLLALAHRFINALPKRSPRGVPACRAARRPTRRRGTVSTWRPMLLSRVGGEREGRAAKWSSRSRHGIISSGSVGGGSALQGQMARRSTALSWRSCSQLARKVSLIVRGACRRRRCSGVQHFGSPSLQGSACAVAVDYHAAIHRSACAPRGGAAGLTRLRTREMVPLPVFGGASVANRRASSRLSVNESPSFSVRRGEATRRRELVPLALLRRAASRRRTRGQ